MGSDQSKTSSYPTSRRRRRSKDYPLLFNQFIDLFYYHRDRLYEIICELERVQASFRDIKNKEDTGQIASGLTSAAGLVVGLLAIPASGGLSLALAVIGIAAGASGTAALIGVTATGMKEKEMANKSIQSLIKEFVLKVESVGEKLEEVRRSCESMSESGQYSRYRKLKLNELELNILRVRGEILSASESTSIEYLEKIVIDLDELCTQIRLTLNYV